MRLRGLRRVGVATLLLVAAGSCDQKSDSGDAARQIVETLKGLPAGSGAGHDRGGHF